jgi:hypothetical protein
MRAGVQEINAATAGKGNIMNTITNELNSNDVESTEAVLSSRQTDEAIAELNSLELSLVYGGMGVAILL